MTRCSPGAATRALVIALVGAGMPAAALHAQTPASAPALTVGAWAGVAHHSPTAYFGHTPSRNVTLLALQLTRSLARSNALALDYVGDVVPLAVVSGPPLMRAVAGCSGSACPGDTSTIERHPIYGFGGAPLGVQLRLAPAARLQPFVAIETGALWFSRPMPIAPAGRFNFMADVGGGAIVRLSDRLGIVAGYKFLHISNGGTADINPGVDNHMLYVGALHFPRP